jgi:hypothetical protein
MAKAASETINWTAGLVVKTFGLTRVNEGFPLLEDWFDVINDLTEADRQQLELRRKKLMPKVNAWNEETLKMKFIAFILDMVDYDVAPYEGLFETEISAVVQTRPLKVITDFTVARVTEDLIEQPYFYFHEYKQRKRSKDPTAQVMLAMLIAQELNQNGKPIYGCYVIGEIWYFMIMEGTLFSIHNGLNAANTDDLQLILLILRKFKKILNTQLVV